MKLRFQCVVPSSNPDYPFQPGQVIDVEKPTAEMKRWLKDGKVIPVHEPDTPEHAVVGEP